MKKIYLTVLALCISFYSISQSDCGWTYTNTASNATIAILDINFNAFTINYGLTQSIETTISDLNCPITLGVFFSNDNGDLVCGGQTVWNNSSSMALSAWGDDPTTAEKDGFEGGESYFFKLCVDGVVYDQEEVVMSTDTPFSNSYSTNGMGNILSINFNAMGVTDLCGDVPVTTYNCDSLTKQCYLVSDGTGSFLTLMDCVLNCESVGVLEQIQEKELIKKVDLYGRNLALKHSAGFVIEIYSDKSVSKVYNF